jgi:geranylgeranyl diphosphate synthase type II
MRYVMTSGGKRLRPVLTILAYRTAGGMDARIYPFALLWEMVHNFSLVHDDLPIMDDDAYRRGKPTLHRLHGQRAAMMTGVELLLRAFALLVDRIREFDIQPRTAGDLIGTLAEASGFDGMVGGQMMDLYQEGREARGEVVETIHRMKTAKMIEGAVAMGAILGGAGDDAVEAFRAYGLHLGFAYQVADDLLDLRSDFGRMGKETGRDSVLRKATFPAVFDEARSEERLNTEVDRARAALRRLDGFDPCLEEILEFTRARGMGRTGEGDRRAHEEVGKR